MFKRWMMIVLCACVMMSAAVLPVSAALENNVLLPAKTALLDGEGTVTYSEDGALLLTSTSENGAAAAITLDQFFNIRNVRYMQVSITADAPFNVAVKMIGEDKDLYPQLTGPSWHTAFGLSSVPKDGYIPAGSYVLSLDVINYVEYNGMVIDKDGYATMESVFVMVKGAGSVTVERLVFSNEPTFTAANGQTGTAAPTVATKKDPNDADATSVSQAIEQSVGAVIQSEDLALILVLVLLATGVVVLAMVTIAVTKKKNLAENADDGDEEIYGDLQTKLAKRGGAIPGLAFEEPEESESIEEVQEAVVEEEPLPETVEDAPDETAAEENEPPVEQPTPASKPHAQPHPNVKQKQYPSSKNGGNKKKSGKKKSGKKKK